MPLSSVLLFGRTNVGKSTLFNRLSRSRAAVVYNQMGVTRDFLTAAVEGRFVLTDSGGLAAPKNDLSKAIEARVLNALEAADVIIWVLDGRCGLLPVEQTWAQRLRKIKKPVIGVVNKVDTERDEGNLEEFYRLGLQHLIPISAEHNKGIEILKQAILDALPVAPVEKPSPEDPLPIRFALVGRPNVGKSSLTNALLGEERVLVSDVAGTTRDAVECAFQWTFLSGGCTQFILIDTAGQRKKQLDPIEFYASVRLSQALEKADLAIVLLDALTGPTLIDKALMNTVATLGKGCIIGVNKWDLAYEHLKREGKQNLEEFQQDFSTALQKACPFIEAPICFVSAKTRSGLESLLSHLKTVYQRLHTPITTGALNHCLQKAQWKKAAPALKGKRFKVYYAVQTQQIPLTFKGFCNRQSWLTPTYERFLERCLREQFSLSGCPIRWEWVEKPHKPTNCNPRRKLPPRTSCPRPI